MLERSEGELREVHWRHSKVFCIIKSTRNSNAFLQKFLIQETGEKFIVLSEFWASGNPSKIVKLLSQNLQETFVKQ
jgi:hypothetical protein